jgi:hypothetical protein
MKKIFPFHIEGKHPDRLLDHHKHEIKKYMRRETRRPLPNGFDFWDFDCRMGSEEALAEMVHPKEINRKINELKALEHPAFFIELLVKAQKRVPKVRSDLDVLAQESTHEDSPLDNAH